MHGTRVKYARGAKIEFPDFTIVFMEQKKVSSPAYPRGFTYYDFKVTKGDIEKTVSWSSGTGDIGPEEFEMNGSLFLLGLRRSDKLGRLEENEMVIWKNP